MVSALLGVLCWVNINTQIHLLSFPYYETGQVVEIFCHSGKWSTYTTQSIAFLLMDWRHREPRHQHTLYPVQTIVFARWIHWGSFRAPCLLAYFTTAVPSRVNGLSANFRTREIVFPVHSCDKPHVFLDTPRFAINWNDSVASIAATTLTCTWSWRGFVKAFPPCAHRNSSDSIEIYFQPWREETGCSPTSYIFLPNELFLITLLRVHFQSKL